MPGLQLWTIQPLEVWAELRSKGVVLVDESRIGMTEPRVAPDCYHWLAGQLRRRRAGFDGHLPWWFYTERPDLRTFRHSFETGERHVRIEVSLPAARVFVMPCWAWHTVYCGEFLAMTATDHAAWERRRSAMVPDEDQWPLPEPLRSELETSWERLFDPDLPASAWEGFDMFGTSRFATEAVCERLLIEDVVRVTEFRGASRMMDRIRRQRQMHSRLG